MRDHKHHAERVHATSKRVHARPHRLSLMHNDLGLHNILVNDDWKISGIID
ncbi:hypothetical protein TRAPUB_14429 [Trametes pubescens]|uniref:Aminoglycoside phosphotransferase domain-containing protein n=1 Tax=Trametes pubescens TaxID=154538 RepID=A0A1M2VNI0_TRAPU|nr:hypothetical protein TRAPUB_14429 [Trametes pubescens]